ncbi:MAG: VWA domain-containing protein, partial [Bacteroidales bacterium]|nr:VWA domain-containing protein [Bacteroidales bacterium]
MKKRNYYLIRILSNFILLFCIITFSQSTEAQNNTEGINNGFVFIDGKYIEAPYIFEVHNLGIYLNGNLVFNPPANRPNFNVIEDPGFPAGLTKNTTIYYFLEKMWNKELPHYCAKLAYLLKKHDKNTAQLEMLNYYKKLPFIKTVEQVEGPGAKVTDYSGNTVTVDLSIKESAFEVIPENKIFKQRAELTQILNNRLQSGQCIFFFKDGTEIYMTERKAAKVLFDVVMVLVSDTLNDNRKHEELINTGIFPKDFTRLYQQLIREYYNSQQLIERISTTREKIQNQYGIEESFYPKPVDSEIIIKVINKKSGEAAYSPDGNFLYVYSPCAFDQIACPDDIYLNVSSYIEKQSYYTTTCIFKDQTCGDDNPGYCTLENFKNCEYAAFLYVLTHGEIGGIGGIFMQTPQEADKWYQGEQNISTMVTNNYPNCKYMVHVEPQWFSENWKNTLNQSKAIVILGICYSYPNITDSVGGSVVFGYPGLSYADNKKINDGILLNRMNGTFGNGNFRTAKASFNIGGFKDGLKMVGEGNITLCPATEVFEPDNGEFVQSSGTGYFMVDTYCRDLVPATEALTFVVNDSANSPIITNVEWVSTNGKANAITFDWDFSEYKYFEVIVKANADKFISWGWSGGGHILDGDGKTPNGDDVIYTFYHKGNPSICYVLDRSGSMEGAPLANAKAAANQGICSMDVGDEVSVVSFAEFASVDYTRHEILGDAEKQAAMNAVNSLYAEGWTSIGAGLLKAYYQLLSSNHKTRDYVLLTDGQENTPPWVADVIHLFQNFKNDTIHHIHTIAFGEGANQQQMAEIAQLTGGLYAYCPYRNDPLAIMNIYNVIQNEISGGQTVSQEENTLTGNQVNEYDVFVDESIFEKRITLIWDNIDENITFEMITPG